MIDDGGEQADSVTFYKCEHCDNLHLILLDEDNEEIATATVSAEVLEEMVKMMKDERADH